MKREQLQTVKINLVFKNGQISPGFSSCFCVLVCPTCQQRVHVLVCACCSHTTEQSKRKRQLSWTIRPLVCQMFLQKPLAWRRSTARCQRPASAAAGSWTALLRNTWLPASAVHICTPPHIVYNMFHPARRAACFHILFSIKQKYGAESPLCFSQTKEGHKSGGIFYLAASFTA